MKYYAPMVEVELFEAIDVVTTSDPNQKDPEGTYEGGGVPLDDE